MRIALVLKGCAALALFTIIYQVLCFYRVTQRTNLLDEVAGLLEKQSTTQAQLNELMAGITAVRQEIVDEKENIENLNRKVLLLSLVVILSFFFSFHFLVFVRELMLFYFYFYL